MNIGSMDEGKKSSNVPVGALKVVVEFACVCALSIAVSIVHLQLLGGPNLTLLFDGFGFLNTTTRCMSAFDIESFKQILSYCASGFDETARLSLASRLQDASNIVRTGPLLPILLGCAYTIAGKAAIPQFWTVATWSMWITQASTIGLIWVAARTAFSPLVARIAALIAIFYPAFILNGNRIASETQACLAVILVTTLFLYFAKKDFTTTRGFVKGFLCGLALAFLALARPPFLLLPVLLIVALSFVAWKIKQPIPFKVRWLIGCICGGALMLAPWALCNKILTGTPAITIDRFALYNLYSGLNARYQGFDFLPGEYVQHPERFKSTFKEVAKDICQFGQEHPAAFATMIVLKPVRLLDSPWNDYQTSCLGVPWLLQRYFHQLLLALGLIALFELWSSGLKQRSLSSFTPPIVLSFVVLYNFIHVLFISMARYTYPIMPVIILLASYGIARVWQSGRRLSILPALLVVPLPTLLIESAIASSKLPAQLILTPGIDFCVTILSATIALAFLYFIFSVNRTFQYSRAFAQGVWSIAIPIVVVLLAAANCGLKQIAVPIETASPSDRIKVMVPISNDNELASRSWLVVVDPLLEGFSLDAIKDCRISVNGKEIPGELYPFIGADRAQRDLYAYSKAFAHSNHSDVSRIRQWYCQAVPPGLVKVGDNSIEFWKSSESHDRKIHVMFDVLDSSKCSSSVSLRQFSWTKGFAINPPLDMRMVERDRDRLVPAREKENVRPRIMLLSVEETDPKTYLQPIGAIESIKFDSVSLSKKGQRMVSLVVPPEKLAAAINEIKSGYGNAVWFKVSGQLGAGPTKASIVSIVKTTGDGGSNETMAPLAPELIECGTGTKRFSFIDIVPAAAAADGSLALSARLVAAGRRWWDVLQYGNYGIDAPVQLDELTVETAVTALPDLSKQKWQLYPCRAISR